MKNPLILLITFPFSPSPSLGGTCGSDIKLTKAYLSEMKEAGNMTAFIPSVYYKGSSSKFISTTGQDSIDHPYLCVDGASSYQGRITLYDDGTHGDDFANDRVYSRECMHYCTSIVNFSDFFNYAMYFKIGSGRSHLAVMDPSVKGTVPYETIETPLTPGAKVIASSHAFYFADVNRRYYPNYFSTLEPNNENSMSGKNVALSALMSIFGDVFDFVTTVPLEESISKRGWGISKNQHWDRRAGPMKKKFGDSFDICSMAVTGTMMPRLVGLITSSAIVDGNDFTGQIHELAHGIAGYEYNTALEAARTGDGMHVPGACTFDHSSLQGPVWDWVQGYPVKIPPAKEVEGAYPGVRLVANKDCAKCPGSKLSKCCSFRYEDVPVTKKTMMEKPNLTILSPLLLYIAGIIKYNQVPKKQRTYYCMGSDTDGGCGTSDYSKKECDIKVNDEDRTHVTSDYVSRFTFDQIVKVNGGRRFPEEKYKVIRHAAIHISRREPTEAEITFYTLLWRNHEIQATPWARIETPTNVRRFPVIDTWLFHTSGKSVLHSRLHGIPCGSKSMVVPSCTSKGDVCDNQPCGPGAICMEFDGQPLCLCREGLVGDGIECAYPSELKRFDNLPSAHELSVGNNGISNLREACFAEGKVWPSFIDEKSLAPYPGGMAPYASTSCGNNICPVGWRCNQGKCLPPTGTDICENKGYSKGQCVALGCCKFKGTCKKKGESCPKPEDPGTNTCKNKDTCCYFSCNQLSYSPNQISQYNNCGHSCTTGISPDINGVLHPELFLVPHGYYTNTQYYTYDTGPMNITGSNKNMFDRCYKECFTEKNDTKFLLRILKNDSLAKKTCKWLKKKPEYSRRKYCNENNLSRGGYRNAYLACPVTCGAPVKISSISDSYRSQPGELVTTYSH